MSIVPQQNRTTWLNAASIVSAVVSSACCWLPLALLVVGVSASGVAATFEKVRPLFLVLSAVFLGVGFYLNYFRAKKCAPGTGCDRPNRRSLRFNRAMLWIVTVMVLAFAFFPNYVSALLEGDSPIEIDGLSRTVVLSIGGMTCSGCEVAVQNAIANVEGVRTCSVEYESGKATILLTRNAEVDTEDLKRAVEAAGYAVTDDITMDGNE